MLRVVIDTSSLVGAALRIGSVPYLALHHVLSHGQLCASAATLDELQQVLRRPKFDRYLSLADRRDFFDIVVRGALILEVPAAAESSIRPQSRDPKDDKFLALAEVGAANVLVSSDDDLLEMDPWHAVRIMTPAAFLGHQG